MTFPKKLTFCWLFCLLLLNLDAPAPLYHLPPAHAAGVVKQSNK